MTKSEAIKHFGSAAELARACGVTRQAVARWPEEIPELRQFQIEKVSEGALQATSTHDTNKGRAA